MSAVRKAANTLRESGRALRELDDDDVICALGRLLASWRDPDGRWQPRLATRLSAAAGFSQANIREGLCLALTGWDEAALRELVDHAGCEVGGEHHCPAARRAQRERARPRRDVEQP